MINTFNIIGFIIIIIVVIIIETIQIYSCILLQIIICLVHVSRKIHVMRGKSCDHSNNVAFCYFLSFFGPPMPCLYEEKLPTHLTELPSIVVSITVMIFFHIAPSSPRSSHIWFSYIHNFRATLYEPTFLTFPYKTWQKVGWTKRLAQQADMWWYMWATVQSSIVNFSPYSLCIILHYGLPTEVN